MAEETSVRHVSALCEQSELLPVHPMSRLRAWYKIVVEADRDLAQRTGPESMRDATLRLRAGCKGVAASADLLWADIETGRYATFAD